MFGRLIWHVDAGERAKLPSPHPGAVHDIVGADLAMRSPDACHPAALASDAKRRHSFKNLYTPLARALGKRHRDIHGIHASVRSHVKARLDIIGLRKRPLLFHLAWRDLLHVDPAIPVETRDPAVLLKAIPIAGHLDETDLRQARRLPGFGLEAAVQIACVLADLGGSL